MKIILIFVVLLLSMVVNLPHGMIVRLGFGEDYLIALLIAIMLTVLLRNRQLYLIVLVVLCLLAANLPVTITGEWGVDPDYFLGILLALVIFPIGIQSSGQR